MFVTDANARGGRAVSRENNFDSLRLIFAICVLVGHCFEAMRGHAGLADLASPHDGLDLRPLSLVSLVGFFAISGYLVSGSYLSSSDVLSFLWKRVLRIWPAFLLVAIVTVVVIGPIGSGNARAYFHDLDVASQLRALVTLHVSHTTAHAFPRNEIHRLNAPTWTLPVEFAMYLLVAFLGATTLLRRRWPVALCWIALALLAAYCARFRPGWAEVPRFAQAPLRGSVTLYLTFVGGAMIRVYPVLRRSTVAGASLVVCLLAHRLHVDYPCDCLVAPVIVIWLGECRVRLPRTRDDLSYGIYLTAWPIQQLLIAFYALDTVPLAACTTVIAVAFATVSWRFVERPALRLKNLDVWSLLFRSRPNRPIPLT